MTDFSSDKLLDRFWLLLPRAIKHYLALSDRISDCIVLVHPCCGNGSPGISSLVRLSVVAGCIRDIDIPIRLILKGQEEEALHVLAALNELPEDDEKIQSEFQSVKDVAFEMASGGFADCFKKNPNRNLHRTILGYVNQMFQQICGTCLGLEHSEHTNTGS